MAILAYDDLMLREPRLLVPRMAPVGPVKIHENWLAWNPVVTLLFGQGNNGPVGQKVWYSAVTGTATKGGSPIGLAVGSMTADSYLTYTLSPAISFFSAGVNSAATVVVVANLASTQPTTWASLFAFTSADGVTTHLGLQRNNIASALYCPDGTFTPDPWALLMNDRPHAIVYGADKPGSTAPTRLWVDGVGPHLTNATWHSDGSAGKLRVLTDRTEGATMRGQVAMLVAFSHKTKMPPEMERSLSIDPFQIFAPA